ncbi:MAG: beta-class carbonic anhydrase [Candidatus Acidiferrales bacterium]
MLAGALPTDCGVRTTQWVPQSQHRAARYRKRSTGPARRSRRIQVSLIDQAIAANRRNAEHHDPSLANKPAPKVAILTCMDPRLNGLLEWLDIKPADADVIRNVGTAATGDVVRSLMFSIHVLGVPEVMIVGHTGCGMEMFSEEEFESRLHTRCGMWAVAPDKFHFYSDVDQATQKQVLKLRSHPWIPSEVAIRGFVLDLATGQLREVTPKDDR